MKHPMDKHAFISKKKEKKKETPKQTAIPRMEMYPYPILPFPTLLVKVEKTFLEEAWQHSPQSLQ